MRSLFAKFLLCMVMVPFLVRGSGLLISAARDEPRMETERAVTAVLPLYATVIAATVEHGGAPDVGQALAAVSAQTGSLLALRVTTQGPGFCRQTGRRTVSVPIPASAKPGLCLTATLAPRPRILGIFPQTWWALLPLVELMACAAMSFFLARYRVRPISRIREAAAAFAGGDLSARAGTPRDRRRDEAADLVRDFDRMADRVAASMQAQQRFIGDVSHEIRSPLARLGLAVGLARREAGPAASARFDRMERELDTVSRLVRELLMLASLQGSTSPSRSEPVDLAAVVQEAMDDLTFEWRERAHGMRLIRRDAAVWVAGDAALLRRVAENVLVNALFYKPDETDVEAIVEHTGAWVRLVVRDRGPGVPPAALGHLFEPFYRVDEARARNTGGVGLGLAICQRAVQLHGGRISAVNSSPGLSVRIELPALTIRPHAPPPASGGRDHADEAASVRPDRPHPASDFQSTPPSNAAAAW